MRKPQNAAQLLDIGSMVLLALFVGIALLLLAWSTEAGRSFLISLF